MLVDIVCGGGLCYPGDGSDYVEQWPLPPVNTIRDVMYGKVMILIMRAMYYAKGLAVVTNITNITYYVAQ